MKKVCLGDYVTISTGKLNANASIAEGIYPFFTCAKEISRINNFAFDCECVLVAGNGELNVKYYKGKFNAYQRTYIIQVNDTNQLSTKYLFHYLNLYIEKLRDNSIGGVIKYIKLNHLTDIIIPLPTLDTQNKIVAILDKAITLIENVENSIVELDKLLYSEFLNLFGEPYRNTKKWNTKSINEVVEKISSGWSAQGEQRLKLDNELGVLKISSVTSGEFRPNEHKAIDRRKVNRNIIIPKKGDLLFSRANTLELVGATCIVDKDYIDLFLPDKLWKIEPVKGVVKAEYLKSVLSSELFRKNFTQFATGSSGSMLNISQEKFRSILLPIPPFQLQEKYSILFWKILEIKNKKREISKYSLSLERSISQRFFSDRVIYNIDAELDALINNVDTERQTNDLASISKDRVFLQRLIDKLQTQEYKEEMYKKAKYSLMQLLKENKGISQQYNSKTQEIELTLE